MRLQASVCRGYLFTPRKQRIALIWTLSSYQILENPAHTHAQYSIIGTILVLNKWQTSNVAQSVFEGFKPAHNTSRTHPAVSPNTFAVVWYFKNSSRKKTQIFILLNDLHTLRFQKKLVAGSTISAISEINNVTFGNVDLHSPLCTPVLHKLSLSL